MTEKPAPSSPPLREPPDKREYVVGDRVCYVLPRAPSNGRQTDWHCPATIVNITPKRIVIRIDDWPGKPRNTLASMIHPMCDLAKGRA
jgi:hypothetical protein